MVSGPVCPLQNRLNRSGPPQGSVELPVQAMLQSVAFAAGPAPGAMLVSQTIVIPSVSLSERVREFWGTHSIEKRIQFPRKETLKHCSN